MTQALLGVGVGVGGPAGGGVEHTYLYGWDGRGYGNHVGKEGDWWSQV